MAGKAIINTVISLQPEIWKRLLKICGGDRVGSAYLFSGPPGCGKEGLAIAFSCGLNCSNESNPLCGECHSCKQFHSLQHEHVTFIVPLPGSNSGKPGEQGGKIKDQKNVELFQAALEEKSKNLFHKITLPRAKQILIGSVRGLRKTLYLKTQTHGRKTVLIFDAHLLSAGQGTAGNALLKILEEPPKNTTIILVTDYKEQLSPTLLSRCQYIDFPPIDQSTMRSYIVDIGIESELIPILTEISQGDMHKACSLFGKSKEEILGMMGEIVSLVFSEKASSWRHFINEYSRLAYTNLTEFRFRVYLLQLWIWSIYKEKSGVRKNSFYLEKENGMESIVQKLLNTDIHILNAHLEEILRGLNRNLNTSLALTNLLIKIHREIQSDKAYA